jgi:hypothetical protein
MTETHQSKALHSLPLPRVLQLQCEFAKLKQDNHIAKLSSISTQNHLSVGRVGVKPALIGMCVPKNPRAKPGRPTTGRRHTRAHKDPGLTLLTHCADPCGSHSTPSASPSSTKSSFCLALPPNCSACRASSRAITGYPGKQAPPHRVPSMEIFTFSLGLFRIRTGAFLSEARVDLFLPGYLLISAASDTPAP